MWVRGRWRPRGVALLVAIPWLWPGLATTFGCGDDLIPRFVKPRSEFPGGDCGCIPIPGEETAPNGVHETAWVLAAVGVCHDAGNCVLKEIEAAAGALGGNQTAHDHASQLRRVGHRASLWVPLHLDGVVHGAIMEHGVCVSLLIDEKADSDVDEAGGRLRGELVFHLVLVFGRQANTWLQGPFTCNKSVVDVSA